MSGQTRVYISLESRAGHLIVNGPMVLWRELLDSLGTAPDEAVDSEQRPAALNRRPAGQPAEAAS